MARRKQTKAPTLAALMLYRKSCKGQPESTRHLANCDAPPYQEAVANCGKAAKLDEQALFHLRVQDALPIRSILLLGILR